MKKKTEPEMNKEEMEISSKHLFIGITSIIVIAFLLFFVGPVFMQNQNDPTLELDESPLKNIRIKDCEEILGQDMSSLDAYIETEYFENEENKRYTQTKVNICLVDALLKKCDKNKLNDNCSAKFLTAFLSTVANTTENKFLEKDITTKNKLEKIYENIYNEYKNREFGQDDSELIYLLKILIESKIVPNEQRSEWAFKVINMQKKDFVNSTYRQISFLETFESIYTISDLKKIDEALGNSAEKNICSHKVDFNTKKACETEETLTIFYFCEEEFTKSQKEHIALIANAKQENQIEVRCQTHLQEYLDYLNKTEWK